MYLKPIIVCDDEENLAQMLVELLEEAGFSALAVHEGRDVRRSIQETGSEIVILDVGLPDIDGIELLEGLKREERLLGRRLRVIVLTGQKDASLQERAMEAGAFYFFAKPTVFQKLLAQVELAVEQVEQDLSRFDDAMRIDSSPEELFDHLVELSLDEAPKLTAMRFVLDRRTVVKSAPEMSGVIVLRDDEARPLHLEWATNIMQRLTYFEALEPSQCPISRAARTFEYVLSDDPLMAGTVFDKLFNELGGFPLLMSRAPEGSKYFSLSEGKIGEDKDEAITSPRSERKATDLKKAEEMVAASPEDPNLRDWLAFQYYSQGFYQKAITAYQYFVDCSSAKDEHFFYLGNAHYKNGDVNQALVHWQKVVDLQHNVKLARKASLRINAAKMKAQKKSPAKAGGN